MMKPVTVLVMLLLPVAAVAQNASTDAVPEGLVVTAPAPGSGVLLLADAAAQTQTPAARGPEPRRRPSMVGYVGDSTIVSQLRLRFDAGRHSSLPDRAEFFYGRCGCSRFVPSSNPWYEPQAAGPGPGILTDLNFEQMYILGEYAVSGRLSVFGELPLRWLQPQEFLCRHRKLRQPEWNLGPAPGRQARPDGDRQRPGDGAAPGLRADRRRTQGSWD